MEKRIRRLGIFMLLCFVALFIQLNNIQIFKANSLANDPRNPRVVVAEHSQTRGSILSSDGTVLASSVMAPEGSAYKYQRVYPQNTATLFAQIIGFAPTIFGNYHGIEAEYNNFLTPHTPSAKTLRDLLVNRTEVDNVTLTVDQNLQLQVAQALDQGAPGVNGAAAVVLNPRPVPLKRCIRTLPSIPTRWSPRVRASRTSPGRHTTRNRATHCSPGPTS